MNPSQLDVMIIMHQLNARISSILSKATLLVVALLISLLWQTTLAQESAPSSADTNERVADSDDNSMLRLQKEVDIAEARFFAVFNSINRDSDYDVECKYEIELRTRRNAQECKAKFQRKYEADLALASVGTIDGIAEQPRPSESRLKKKQERFGKKIADAVGRHSDLFDAMNEFAAATKRLEAERKKRM